MIIKARLLKTPAIHCALILVRIFRTQEAVKTFDPAKYCKELHAAIKNLP